MQFRVIADEYGAPIAFPIYLSETNRWDMVTYNYHLDAYSTALDHYCRPITGTSRLEVIRWAACAGYRVVKSARQANNFAVGSVDL